MNKLTKNLTNPMPEVESYTIELTPEQLVELRVFLGNVVGPCHLSSLYHVVRTETDRNTHEHTGNMISHDCGSPQFTFEKNREQYLRMLKNARSVS